MKSGAVCPQARKLCIDICTVIYTSYLLIDCSTQRAANSLADKYQNYSCIFYDMIVYTALYRKRVWTREFFMIADILCFIHESTGEEE